MSAIIKEFKKVVKETTGRNIISRKLEIKQISGQLLHNHIGARQFLEKNIVEVRFVRKLPYDRSKGQKKTRRMICTRDFRFARRFARHFGNFEMPRKPQHKRTKGWYKERRILLVWDLLSNSYKMVHLKRWKILDYIPIIEENVDIINEFSRKLSPRRMTDAKRINYHKK